MRDAQSEIEVRIGPHGIGELGKALHHVGWQARHGDGGAALHRAVKAADQSSASVFKSLGPLFFNLFIPEILAAFSRVAPHEVFGVPLLVVDFHLLRGTKTGENRHDTRDRVVFTVLDVFQHLVAQPQELSRLGERNVFGAPDHDCLDSFVAHHRTNTTTARARTTLLDRGIIDPVFPGKPNRGHLGLRFLEFALDDLGSLDGALAGKMRSIANFNLVVVDPEVDQVGRLAAQDHLVVAGILQFRRPETTHHRKSHQLGLRGYCRKDGPVAPGGGRAAE